MKTIYQANFPDIPLRNRGKVRDIFDLGDSLLFVATDRISAFDVVMNEPVPYKGAILTQISKFWLEKTKSIIPNHFVTDNIDEYPDVCKKYKDDLLGRSMIVKKCKPLPIEAIVRGYIAGSGWKEYQKSRTICGIPLPEGLVEFQKLPEPIYTPSTKEEVGHDINVNFEYTVDVLGEELANRVREVSLDLFKFASEYLEERGLILADTKFEFGLDENGQLILIDEVLTPDSSRFWLKEDYAPGKPQYNFDKQVLRDYLESLNWNKVPPPPPLPNEVINKIVEKYKEAYHRILGKPFEE
ncbi:MAG: Phosphoribosylaminoimidazole-succinocarboxamide synthase [Candidatus Kapaibacterium sp.]|jgi:phosphoribosylaminoimidazole-succinocarboxamide synthase|nr:MAG: Phosphoribosylaminoimidazole-succinocarboxamide synthase [Candidatus Kapabacteria bacterium]ROL58558.1 MAG: phosphoribosylaminoimidazolesuccinocarboxamide synthase [Bacteroidetes/Chlorobi group bacterium Naka2016]